MHWRQTSESLRDQHGIVTEHSRRSFLNSLISWNATQQDSSFVKQHLNLAKRDDMALTVYNYTSKQSFSPLIHVAH